MHIESDYRSLQEVGLKLLFLLLGDDGFVLLLVHDSVSNLPEHLGGLLGEEESLAELAALVGFIHDSTDFAEGLDHLEGLVKHGVWLALVHVGHHHLHWAGHVDVCLDLGVDNGRLAVVVLELLLALEEEASLRSRRNSGSKALTVEA